MWSSLLLLACTPDAPTDAGAGPPPSTTETAATAATGDTGPPPIWRTDPRYIWVDAVATATMEPDFKEYPYGSMLTVGSDLDQDGIMEWAVGVPSMNRFAIVKVYEGTEFLGHRRVLESRMEYEYPLAILAHDFDGDGFGDLGIALGSDAHCLEVATNLDHQQDHFYAIQSDHPDGWLGTPRYLAPAGDDVLVGWTQN